MVYWFGESGVLEKSVDEFHESLEREVHEPYNQSDDEGSNQHRYRAID
jgi:hypothetical protein